MLKKVFRLAVITKIALGLFLTAQTFTAYGQANGVQEDASTNTIGNTVLKPVWDDYKNVTIGMTFDEVKDKLGKPTSSGEDFLYYAFSEDETVQVMFDKDKKANVIAVSFVDRNGSAPKVATVFGDGISVEPSADGKIYKMVQYPEAGFWVAYSHLGNSNPLVTITMQRMSVPNN